MGTYIHTKGPEINKSKCDDILSQGTGWQSRISEEGGLIYRCLDHIWQLDVCPTIQRGYKKLFLVIILFMDRVCYLNRKFPT